MKRVIGSGVFILIYNNVWMLPPTARLLLKREKKKKKKRKGKEKKEEEKRRKKKEEKKEKEERTCGTRSSAEKLLDFATEGKFYLYK
jgi:uncharacterized membrane protein YgaE (UPF0421/DUF939 family)